MTFIKNIFVLFLLSSLLFVGCKPKSLDINIPELEPKIVVNSFAIEGFMIVILTKSFSPLADTTDADYFEKIAISGADVSVIDPIEQVHFFEIPDSLDGISGVYIGAVQEQPHFSYILKVNTIEFGDVHATTEMLKTVGEYNYTITRSTSKPDYVQVDYSLTDITDRQDWYAIGVSGGSQEELFEGVDTLRDLNTSSYELIDDRAFSGNEITGSFEIKAEKYDTLTFSLSHISEPYYEYLQVLNKSNNIFSSITKEPINYPTNVRGGGLGFFNAFFPVIERIVVEE